ncbi:hypothetical protein POK33_37885 [Burkholderia cenocepacia]|uniref:hypothetical protein n=1 Tax=Burkholderia cenocepacia TaxID=95486 RepID=UPI0023B9D4A5|nr:hypothetical protein [Burkholderia cenocepacia]MDF0506528.1 hypothetical protein [Burkholderia cenocepacia]
MSTLDEIKPIRQFTKDGGDWAIKCGHCDRIIGVEDGEEDGTPRGEQYECRCGGWNSVDFDASYTREL